MARGSLGHDDEGCGERDKRVLAGPGAEVRRRTVSKVLSPSAHDPLAQASIMRWLLIVSRVSSRLGSECFQTVLQCGEVRSQVSDLALLSIDNVAQLSIRAFQERDFQFQSFNSILVHFSPLHLSMDYTIA